MNDLMYRLFGLIPWVKRVRLETMDSDLKLRLFRRRVEMNQCELNTWLAEREVIGLLIRRHYLVDYGYPLSTNLTHTFSDR